MSHLDLVSEVIQLPLEILQARLISKELKISIDEAIDLIKTHVQHSPTISTQPNNDITNHTPSQPTKRAKNVEKVNINQSNPGSDGVQAYIQTENPSIQTQFFTLPGNIDSTTPQSTQNAEKLDKKSVTIGSTSMNDYEDRKGNNVEKNTQNQNKNKKNADLSSPNLPTRVTNTDISLDKSPTKPRPPGLDWNQLHRRRVALRFCYVGTDYAGFAFQKEEMEQQEIEFQHRGVKNSNLQKKLEKEWRESAVLKTVEGELLRALRTSCLIPSYDLCNYTKCGRTDRGVHGLTQVVSLDIKTKWKPQSSRVNVQNVPKKDENNEIDFSLPHNFSCWCDIPGYVPPYATYQDYVSSSQSMQHADTCRRRVDRHDGSMEENQNNFLSNTFRTPLQTPTSHSHSPTPTPNPLSPLRSESSIYIPVSKFRLLDFDEEYNELYSQLTREIENQPQQVLYYSTKQQASLNTYSQFEIDWFLNHRFRPWYGDLIVYHRFQQKLQDHYFENLFQKNQLQQNGGGGNNEEVKINADQFGQNSPLPLISTLALPLHPCHDPFIPLSGAFPVRIANKNPTNPTNPKHENYFETIQKLENIYSHAINPNFASSTAKQYDNSLFLSYIKYNYRPEYCSNALIATQDLPLFLSPLEHINLIHKNHRNKPQNEFNSENNISFSESEPPQCTSSPHDDTNHTHSLLISLSNSLSSKWTMPEHTFLSLTQPFPRSIPEHFHCPPREAYTSTWISNFDEYIALQTNLSNQIDENIITPISTNYTLPHTPQTPQLPTTSSQPTHLTPYIDYNSPYKREYDQDIVLPLHPDQEWIDNQEYDYIGLLNRVLPPTIRLVAWAPVAPSFTARFHCDGRAYKYFFYLDQMDLCKMNQAGRKFVGKYDFRNICTMDVVMIDSFIRVVSDISVQPVENIDVVNYIQGQKELEKGNCDVDQNMGLFGEKNTTITSHSRLTSIGHLEPSVFNANTILQSNSQLHSPDSFPSPQKSKYIPCRNDPDNKSCYLCHTSTYSSSETLCEAVIVGESFLYHQIRTMMALLFMVGRGEEDGGIITELLDVEKNPARPQFPFASDRGLVLWECAFHNLDWKTTMGGIVKASAGLHAMYRELKLKTHIVEAMWRATIPSATHLIHQYIVKMLVPYSQIQGMLMWGDVEHKQEKFQLSENVGFIGMFLDQYNKFHTHHNKIQRFIKQNGKNNLGGDNNQENFQPNGQQDNSKPKKRTKQEKSEYYQSLVNHPIPPLSNSTVSTYFDVYNAINTSLTSQFGLNVHQYAEIMAWLYNLFNPNMKIDLVKVEVDNGNDVKDDIIDQNSEQNSARNHESLSPSDQQSIKSLLLNSNNTIPYYNSTPYRTTNRILSVTPLPLTHISPTLPSYLHFLSADLVLNLSRSLSMVVFQFEISNIPTSVAVVKHIYITLLFAYYIYQSILASRKTNFDQNDNFIPVPPLSVMSPVLAMLSSNQYLYPTLSSHSSLLSRPREATLEQKMAKLRGVKKQRKEKNLELDQVYGQ